MKAYFFDFGKGLRERGQRGSIVLYVMVVVALISLVFVGWLELMTNRVRTVDVQVYSMKRRLAYENARVLLRQYLVSVVQNADAGTAFSASLADGWGSLTVAADWSKTPGGWIDPVTDSNLFFPSCSGWFTSGGASALTATLASTVNVSEAGGAQTLTETVTAVLHTRSWGTLDAYVDAAVAALTAEAVDGDVEHLVDAPSDNWYVSDGAGNVTLKLNQGPPLVITVSNALVLSIEGEPLDSVVACTVYVDQSATGTALTDINFVGSNGMPFYLGVSNPAAAVRLDLNFQAGETWEMTAVFDGTAAQIAVAPAAWNGYIITDGSFLPVDTANLRTRGWDEIYNSYP